VIELIFLQELPATEISDLLGVSSANVRILRHRAFRVLREATKRKEAL